MSQVEFGQLSGETDAPRTTDPVADLSRLSAVPVDLSVEIGRTRMTVGETLALREGSVVTLDKMAGEAVDLLVNGTPIARGEVVVIDEQFGLRLTKVLSAAASAKATEEAAPMLTELPELEADPIEDSLSEPVDAEPVE